MENSIRFAGPKSASSRHAAMIFIGMRGSEYQGKVQVSHVIYQIRYCLQHIENLYFWVCKGAR